MPEEMKPHDEVDRDDDMRDYFDKPATDGFHDLMDQLLVLVQSPDPEAPRSNSLDKESLAVALGASDEEIATLGLDTALVSVIYNIMLQAPIMYNSISRHFEHVLATLPPEQWVVAATFIEDQTGLRISRNLGAFAEGEAVQD